jgi:hypothetical protein
MIFRPLAFCIWHVVESKNIGFGKTLYSYSIGLDMQKTAKTKIKKKIRIEI